MHTLTYLHDLHPSATIVDAPYTGHSGAGVSGYGGKIRTAYMVRIGKRMHRLYVMCWSNSGTCYVRIKGKRVIVDESRHERESPDR